MRWKGNYFIKQTVYKKVEGNGRSLKDNWFKKSFISLRWFQTKLNLNFKKKKRLRWIWKIKNSRGYKKNKS